MTYTASLGDKLKLSELGSAANAIKVTLKWRLLPDLKNPPEGDLFCFLCDKTGIAPTNEDFIFFNNLHNQKESVVLVPPVFTEGGANHNLEGTQTLTIALNELRYEIVDIVIGINLYRANERDQSRRYLEHLSLALCLDDNTPLLHYECNLAPHKTTVNLTMLHLKREGSDWHVEVVDETQMGFNDLAREKGILVSS